MNPHVEQSHHVRTAHYASAWDKFDRIGAVRNKAPGSGTYAERLHDNKRLAGEGRLVPEELFLSRKNHNAKKEKKMG
jgi:hypothetical protein